MLKNIEIMACKYFYNGKTYSKEELIDMISKDDIPNSIESVIPHTQNDIDILKTLLKIPNSLTLEDYIESSYPDFVDTVNKLGLNIEFTFDSTKISGLQAEQVDNDINLKMNISLNEVFNESKKHNIDLESYFNYQIEHELAHAVSLAGIINPEVNKILNNFLSYARSVYTTHPFEDGARGNVLEADGFPRALSNVQEFVAEFYSNPDFKVWLKSIKNQENPTENLWSRIINFLRDLLGFGNISTLYDNIDQVVTSEKFKNNSITTIKESPEELVNSGILGFNSYWYHTSETLQRQYEYNPEVKDILDNIPKVVSELKNKLSKINKTDKSKQKDINNLNSLIQEFYKIEKDEEGKQRVKLLIDVLQSAYLIAQNINTDLQSLIYDQKVYEQQQMMALTQSEDNEERIEFEANREKLDEEENKRILLLYTLNRQAESLSSLDDLIKEIFFFLNDAVSTDTDAKRFAAQISLISSIKNEVNLQYLKMAKKATIKRFSIAEADSATYQELTANIRKNTELRDKAKDTNTQRIYQNRIDYDTKRLNLVPTKRVLEAMLSGELPDASMADLQIVSLALNGNSLIQRANRMLMEYDNKLADRKVEKNNIMATFLNKFKDAKKLSTLRNMNKEITQHITTPVTRVIRIVDDESGNPVPETVQQLAFVGDYDPQYITDFEMLEANINYLENKRNKISKQPNNEQDLIDINLKIQEAYKAKYKFIKDHSEKPNDEEFYLHRDILEEPISGIRDGKIVETTLGSEFKDIFSQIESRERYKRQTTDANELLEISQELTGLWSQYSEVASRFTNLGHTKTGLDYKLYLQAVRYKEAKSKVGTYQLTEEGKIAYNKALAAIQDEFRIKKKQVERDINFAKKTITNQNELAIKLKQLDKKEKQLDVDEREAFSELQQTRPTQEYFDELKRLRDLIQSVKEDIIQIPNISELLDKDVMDVLKQNITENYNKLRELVGAYRDGDGAIDGVAYTANKPETIQMIKEIQELEQSLRQEMRSFKLKLSKSERSELYILSQKRKRNQDMSNEEINRLAELQDLNLKLKTLKDQMTAEQQNLFLELEVYTEEYSKLQTSAPTKYYEIQKNREIKKITDSLANEYFNDIPKFFETFGLKEVADGKIALASKDASTGHITWTTYWDTVQEAIAFFSQDMAKDLLDTTEWFKNNHYWKEGIYDAVSEEFYDDFVPIYIWMEPKPKKPEHIGSPQPSIAFKTFIPNKLNENYKLIAPGLAHPKPSSKYYKNPKLAELKKDEDLYELYTSLKDFYYKSQEDTGMADFERLFDILPSIPKHNQENKIALVDTVKNTDFKEVITNFWQSLVGKVDDDSQFIQEGSISKKFKTDKYIPYRFNNKMDTSKQTTDLFTMLLIYDGINSDVLNKKNLEEVFQTALAATTNLKRTRDRSVPEKEDPSLAAGGLNLNNLVSVFKGKSKKTLLREELEGKSVLNQTLQHILDTYIYGESRIDASVALMGRIVDGHKVAGQIKKLSSRMIFGLKWFGPTKNYLSTIINGFVNTGLFFSNKNYAEASAQASLAMGDIIRDYRKIGNKSHLGQSLDFFKVLQGGIENQYGDKVMWSALGEMSDMKNLTIIKNSAELLGQITTFLAISKANQVTIGNKTVDFHNAFETTKDGKFKPIEGALFKGKPLTNSDITTVIGTISQVNRRLNGAFRDLEKSKVEKHALGGLLFYLNGFVIPGIKSRFAGDYQLEEADKPMVGYYREFFRFFREGLKHDFAFKTLYTSLDKDQRTRLRMFGQEILIATLFAVIVKFLAAGGGDSKEELKKNTALHNYLFALMIGVGSEIQTFIPLPGLGMDEALRKINNPFAAFRQVVVLGKMVNNFLDYIDPFGEDDAGEFKIDGVKDGLHDKGDPKFIAELVALTGWNMKEWDSVEKVLQAKRAQILR